MTPAHSHPHPPRGARARRGFAFLMVLMMLGIATLTLAVGLQRAYTHTAIVERQLDGYRRHHELLGMRDYCWSWLDRGGKDGNDARKLAEFAASREVAHRLVLENDVVVLISVLDGQGSVLRNLQGVTDENSRRWLIGMLARLPEGRPELTRSAGPLNISLRAASDEVIDAMAGFDPEVALALREARDRGVQNDVELQAILERANVEPNLAMTLQQFITFQPTIWRLNVEVVHPDRVNRYTILAEKRGNMSTLYEWRPVSDAEAQRTFFTDVESRGL
ncbi:MAG: hypothetical protein SFZ24_05630 [Planctomycetota bacterium]|nr:hypothetical protein [Planctomycetota bacterium]